jgi:hypothetical protein
VDGEAGLQCAELCLSDLAGIDDERAGLVVAAGEVVTSMWFSRTLRGSC